VNAGLQPAIQHETVQPQTTMAPLATTASVTHPPAAATQSKKGKN